MLWLGGIWSGIFAGTTACSTAPVSPPSPDLSPPVAEISGQPWTAAERLSAAVPNSTLLVGHGDSMLPLYPAGTVLVLQKILWEHLRRGMTVAFSKRADTPFAMVAHVLKARHDDRWETQGLNNALPDDTAVTRENYLGVVVAAFRRAESGGAGEMLAQVAVSQQATCMMRCHVAERGNLPEIKRLITPGPPF